MERLFDHERIRYEIFHPWFDRTFIFSSHRVAFLPHKSILHIPYPFWCIGYLLYSTFWANVVAAAASCRVVQSNYFVFQYIYICIYISDECMNVCPFVAIWMSRSGRKITDANRINRLCSCSDFVCSGRANKSSICNFRRNRSEAVGWFSKPATKNLIHPYQVIWKI